MSRYTFAGNKPELVVVAGWDNQLETYFAQVWDGGEPEGGGLLLWLGGERREVPTVCALEAHLASYGEIPREIYPELLEDGLSLRPATTIKDLLRR